MYLYLNSWCNLFCCRSSEYALLKSDTINDVFLADIVYEQFAYITHGVMYAEYDIARRVL